MPEEDPKKEQSPPPPGTKLTPIYLALLTGGIILIGHALQAFQMWRVSLRLGTAFLATALILASTRDLRLGIISLAILWAGVAVTFL